MSKIIKSFRVIDEDHASRHANTINEQEIQIDPNITKTIITEARQKSIKIIAEANEGAKRILEDAYNKSEEKINKAYENSKEIFHNAKLEGYEIGYKDGKKEGYNDGYEIGYNEGKEASEKLIEEALEIKNQYIQIRNQVLKETEKDIIELIITIYEKVLYKKVEEDEELIVSLVLKGIDNLEVSEKLTIIVSQEDYETVEKSKNLILAKASLIDELDIRVNSDMKKGDCMIETSMGSVDVSINSQLEEVKDLLVNILSNE